MWNNNVLACLNSIVSFTKHIPTGLVYCITRRDRGTTDLICDSKYVIFPRNGYVLWLDNRVGLTLTRTSDYYRKLSQIVHDLELPGTVDYCFDLVYEPDLRVGEYDHVHVITYDNDQFMRYKIPTDERDDKKFVYAQFEYLALRMIHKMCCMLMRLVNGYVLDRTHYSRTAYMGVALPLEVVSTLHERYEALGYGTSSRIILNVVKTIRCMMYNMSLYFNVVSDIESKMRDKGIDVCNPEFLWGWWCLNYHLFTLNDSYDKISEKEDVLYMTTHVYDTWYKESNERPLDAKVMVVDDL